MLLSNGRRSAASQKEVSGDGEGDSKTRWKERDLLNFTCRQLLSDMKDNTGS